ncbi:MAG: 4Fe-4S binding protein [Spirochaetota bacterium]|nr:4Fe-4S binding protein [Spirochaetota bacterium]
MKLITVRRISQSFFFLLFLWFCIVSTVGEKFWQIRGWPIEWLLQLDPLVALGTILSTHKLYWPLLWSLGIIVLTIIFGRFFCGWICPFGSIHQSIGYLCNRNAPTSERISLNRYRRTQNIKYYILLLFIITALIPIHTSTLHTGLLDPIPLLTRSFNLVLLPILDNRINITSIAGRYYEEIWMIFSIFLAALFLNLKIPRFYCRFICPLGALLGVFSRFSIWRIGQSTKNCINCKQCELSCEGGCNPDSRIRTTECILCLNCREDCGEGVIKYQIKPSIAGETSSFGISRKGFLLSLGTGLLVMPALRLSRSLEQNWHHKIIRPPGSLSEQEFVRRCIKCGQCIRVCPTNVLQPGGIEGGFENLWTPVLNNRIGSSGCQYNCVSCGQVCPTSAIRPITLDEKHGKGKFVKTGFIRIGTAFIDRGRCLPWAMDIPCIVCQENCPVSPKAIYTDEIYATIRGGVITAEKIGNRSIEVLNDANLPSNIASGDYYCLIRGTKRKKIIDKTKNRIVLSQSIEHNLVNVNFVEIQVRLQRPYIDIQHCNGCGICEHECPVSGKRAIRVSGVGESRSRKRSLMLKQKNEGDANEKSKEWRKP